MPARVKISAILALIAILWTQDARASWRAARERAPAVLSYSNHLAFTSTSSRDE